MLSGPSGHWILHKSVDSFFAALLGADTSLRCESEQAGVYCIVPRWRHSNIVLDSTLCWLQKGQVQSNFRLCKAEIRRRCTWKNLVRRPRRRAEGQSMQSVAQWLSTHIVCRSRSSEPIALALQEVRSLISKAYPENQRHFFTVPVDNKSEFEELLRPSFDFCSTLLLFQACSLCHRMWRREERWEKLHEAIRTAAHRWRWGNCGWQVHRQPWETQMDQVTIWLQFPDLDMQRLEINPHRIVLSYCA